MLGERLLGLEGPVALTMLNDERSSHLTCYQDIHTEGLPLLRLNKTGLLKLSGPRSLYGPLICEGTSFGSKHNLVVGIQKVAREFLSRLLLFIV